MRTDHHLFLDLTGDGLELLDQFDFGTTQADSISDGYPDDEIVKTEPGAEFGFGTQAFGTTPFGGTAREDPVARFFYPNSYELVSFTRIRNGIGSFTAQIPGGRDLSRWLEADAYILDGAGEINFVGTVWSDSHSEAAQTMTFTGVDLMGELDRGSVSVVYEGRRAWTVFDEYVHDYVPGWTVAIEPPEVTEVITDKKIQTVSSTRSEIEGATDFGETDPFEIDNGVIRTKDTAWTTESTNYERLRTGGEDADGTSAFHQTGSEYSAGEAIRFSEENDLADYTFGPEYTVPQIRIAVRTQCVDAPRVELRVNNSPAVVVCAQGGNEGLHWVDLRLFDDEWSNVSGETDIEFRAVTAPGESGGYADIDVVAPRDLRYPATFDNDPDPRVRGPETKPRGASFTTNRESVERNVTGARVNADVTTSPYQAIEVSNNRTDFDGDLDTDSLSVDLRSTYGYGLEVEFTFDNLGERTGETPTTGFESTELSGWEVKADASDLKVIDGRELDGTHIENLQWVAERARLSFYGEADRRHLEAFHREQNTVDLPLTKGDYEELTTEQTTGEEYANRVVVKGAYDENGERYIGTVQDDDEIAILADIGSGDGVVTHVKVDGTVDSDTSAQTEAESLLERMSRSREFDGDITGLDPGAIPAGLLDPGVEYFIQQWGGVSLLDSYTVTGDGVEPTFGEIQRDALIRRISSNTERADEAHRIR